MFSFHRRDARSLPAKRLGSLLKLAMAIDQLLDRASRGSRPFILKVEVRSDRQKSLTVCAGASQTRRRCRATTINPYLIERTEPAVHPSSQEQMIQQRGSPAAILRFRVGSGFMRVPSCCAYAPRSSLLDSGWRGIERCAGRRNFTDALCAAAKRD